MTGRAVENRESAATRVLKVSFVIDPTDITRFDRTDDELLEFWLFCLFVAGKTAKTQARKLEEFIQGLPPAPTMWPGLSGRLIAAYSEGMTWHLSRVRVGQYDRLRGAIGWTLGIGNDGAALDLRNDPVEAFETIPGVGPKTARFFLMHTRPDQRIAALDTHILKFLRENGVEDVPKATPGSARQYRRLERAFLDLADQSGMTIADFDLQTWNRYSRA